MPKKRKRPRKQDRPRNHGSNAGRSLESMLSAFTRWVRERHPEADTTEYADVVRTAVEMKANRLGEPSPTAWDGPLVDAVVGGAMPAKMLVDDDYARVVVPGMRAYLEFLAESGRFKGDEDTRREALRVLDELEPTMVERFRSIDNKSMAGRLMSLAKDEGVDVTDEAQVGAFMERFNSMPQEWREHMTGGPDPDRLAADADFLFDVAEPDVDEKQTRPRFDVVVPREADERAALRELLFLRRVTALLDWVGTSRRVTGTGALRRQDIPEVARLLDIELPGVALQSMWEFTALADVWFAATKCGILERTATTVRPGPHSEAWRRGDPVDVLRLGRALVGQLVLQVVGGSADGHGMPFAAQLSGLLTMLLGTAAAGVQHDLRELAADVGLGMTPAGPMGTFVFDLATRSLERLEKHGVVSLTRSRLRVARPLGPSFIQPLREFGFDLDPVDANGRQVPWEAPPMPVPDRVGSDGATAAELSVTYQVKVQLKGSKPPIWRRLRLAGDVPLDALHDVIQTAFGWTDSHMHRFTLGSDPYGDDVRYEPARQREFDLDLGGKPSARNEFHVTLAQVAPRPRDKITYLYDFGDDWIHTVIVESIDAPDPSEPLPRCTGGRRMAPHEDSGGVRGWEMKVAAVLDETDGEHEDVREWLDLEPGERFDPDEFDPDAVTTALR